MADTHRFIGDHPEQLEDGRPLVPGQGIPRGVVDVKRDKDKQLVDDGLIIELPTAKASSGQKGGDAK